MRKCNCILCESVYDKADDDWTFLEGKFSVDLYGVCPTCRKAAEIGRRVMGMKEREIRVNACLEAVCEADGYNFCLREAKGEPE